MAAAAERKSEWGWDVDGGGRVENGENAKPKAWSWEEKEWERSGKRIFILIRRQAWGRREHILGGRTQRCEFVCERRSKTKWKSH